MTKRFVQTILKITGVVSLLIAAGYAADGWLRARTGVEAPAPVLWRDPGDVASLDFELGPGGAGLAPRPPFTFREEDGDGNSPKVKVVDAAGVKWSVKWGPEAHAEIVATRLAWACGYFVEPAYYVPSGRIEGVKDLERAGQYVDAEGNFAGARFERKDSKEQHQDEESWSLAHNPFAGGRELDGLKVLVMLTSNWDMKDTREGRVGSNTAVLEYDTPAGVESRYVISDWGGSLGRWGGPLRGTKWDCAEYAGQSAEFVARAEDGTLRWGYAGFHADEITSDVTPEDVRWLMGYLGRVTDAQIVTALRASGASPEEVECFARAIRDRIERLRAVS